MLAGLFAAWTIFAVDADARSHRPSPRHPENRQPPQAQAQRDQQGSDANLRGTEQSPIVVKVLTPPNTETGAAQATKQDEHKASTEGGLIWFNAGLVAVGAFQLCAFVWQGHQLKRSVDILSQSERAQLFVIVLSELNDPRAARSSVTCTFKNYGKTPAIVKEISLRLAFFGQLPA